MTNEEKQLLFRVLCEMLPYGVIVRCNGVPKNPYYDHTEIDGDFELLSVFPKKGMATIEHYGNYNLMITNCLPYLRPMSSMTEEEYQEFGYDVLRYTPREFDWLNSHHFDYRNLISMGLALEAPEGMYKTE